MKEMSRLQQKRLEYRPLLPSVLRSLATASLIKIPFTPPSAAESLKSLFPHTWGKPPVAFEASKHAKIVEPFRVGVVFSGGQAAGGHNVIAGLFDALKELHPESKLWGFIGGPSGIIDGKHKEIKKQDLEHYRNQGGFDLIGSGRTKIETPEQMKKALAVCESLKLHGLVIIGGDDSNTNAALLAEYFASEKNKTAVIGVPKTIDGDLRNDHIEMSFGFDTACKIYSELIGNIARDALSAKKYYHFIRLMGRSASHITLECALATRPNLVLISEEIAKEKKSLKKIVSDIADLIVQRSIEKKDYGVILIPEGLIEFIPEIKTLIKELNVNLKIDALTKESREVFEFLPKEIQEQLLIDRDPHGNVQVSLIETEKLLSILVAKELKARKESYKAKFSSITHFFGYEGRCGMPSNFDANYCYALGCTAALLIREEANGYTACIKNLRERIENWQPQGTPISLMFTFEKRQGKDKPVIKKYLVDLEDRPFQLFMKMRKNWQLEDHYLYPGPMQFFGDPSITDAIPSILVI